MKEAGAPTSGSGSNAHAKATPATKSNRLASEPSPYLRQHANNPVDWWPWGPAAFAEARRRDVPVFLSIGYATCHWCHVMAHDSFEDPGVARLMNDAFVNVKVDREERPDVDDAYMAVCQAMTGSGGWPLTVMLTPDKKPFFAGTFFPKLSRHGRIGMMDLVPRIQEAWQDKRPELLGQAQEILDHIGAAGEQGRRGGHSHARGDGHEGGAADAATMELPDEATTELDASDLEAGHDGLAKRFDAKHGGFGGAPKFPSPHNLLFLLRRHARTRDPKTLATVTQTLHSMADGGIHDHVGGGFHRYATDRTWLLPHFEKMLYDQAMLAMAYTEAFQVTKDARFADVARGILDYVLRDLADPAGGFRCAEDADSEGEEGKFYVWTRAELETILGKDADVFCAAYGVAAGGNFHDEATHELTGANIFHIPRSLDVVAKAKGITPGELERRLAAGRALLLAARSKRIRPLLDDKVLTDWNGLAIAAFAKTGVALAEPRYVAAALGAATFLRREMNTRDGRLRHRWHAGQKDATAFLDDHAFLIWGLLELYDATFDPSWLTWATDVAAQLRRFRDPAGGFYQAPDDGEDLGVRRKEAYDGALPSGNSVMAWTLHRLALLTGDQQWAEEADATIAAFASAVRDHPAAFTMMLNALDLALGPTQELVVAGQGPQAEAMMQAASGYRPRLVRLAVRPGLAAIAPWTEGHVARGGKATAYLCEGHACEAPVTAAAHLESLLARPPGGTGGKRD